MKTDAKNESLKKEEEEPTYFRPELILKISSVCGFVSNLSLVLAVIMFVYSILEFIRFMLPLGFTSLDISIGTLGTIMIPGFGILICLFFWVFLRAVAEGLLLLMDIYDITNQHRAQGESKIIISK